MACVEGMVQQDRHVTAHRVATIASISIGRAHLLIHDVLQCCISVTARDATSSDGRKQSAANGTQFDTSGKVLAGKSGKVHHHRHRYSQELQATSLNWKHTSLTKTKLKRQRSAEKMLLMSFWDEEGVLHMQLLQQGATLNVDTTMTQ
jgi:hypothetical protein